MTKSQHAANKYLDLKDAHINQLHARIHHGEKSKQHEEAARHTKQAFADHEEAKSHLNGAEKHMHEMGINENLHHRTVK